MHLQSLQERYQTVQQEIREASLQNNRQLPSLLAVSKFHPTSSIRELYNLGQRQFGENYAQELSAKASELAELDIHWSFIGQLQSNKIKSIVQSADEIQSLASIKHGKAIAKAAIQLGKTPYPVYIAINGEGEEQKAGVALQDLEAFKATLAETCPELRVLGLMCIPPKKYSDTLKEVPKLYQTLRSYANTTGGGKLSLGMSADLNIAIAAGTDQVRIGTAIFGERPQKTRPS